MTTLPEFRMRLFWLLSVAAAGCGGGTTDVKPRQFSAEEKQQIAARDKQIDDEELSGSGTAVARGKGRKK